MVSPLAGAGQSSLAVPTSDSARIDSLDIVRGVALLGILLLNIWGFGLDSSSYFGPQADVEVGSGRTSLNLQVWFAVSLLFEGSMRALFSLLFGAGVLLFLSNGRASLLHFKRNFWLLLFGLFDAYVLLWTGDILIVYALASLLLFPLRNLSSKRLLAIAFALMALLMFVYTLSSYGLSLSREAATQVAQAQAPEMLSADIKEQALVWQDFEASYQPSAEGIAAELAQRQASYISAAQFVYPVLAEQLLFALPTYLLGDALLLMLVGMAFYRWNILDASRSGAFYWRLMLGGFALGLSVNGYELWYSWVNDFDLLAQFSYLQPTYDVGRTAMALGYLGLILLWCKNEVWAGLKARLAAVGRMALTNYLTHSVICLFLFTGAGFGLIGTLQRWELYFVVLAIWLFQLWFSPWWLARYRFGPAEWLWRALTYGARPLMRR